VFLSGNLGQSRSGRNKELDAARLTSNYRGGCMSKLSAPVESAPGTTQNVSDVLALVRERGGRVTSARRFVLEAIFEAKNHQTAEEVALVVQRRAPDVHISTIYRNLDDLQELGIVVHSHLGHGPSTYHLAATAHGHLVCAECHDVIEAPVDLFAGLSESSKKRFGFTIDPLHFAMLGRCRNCG
jgi:Fur family ferric uptake transcriptional regulator